MKHARYSKPGFEILEFVLKEAILQSSGDAGSLIGNEIERDEFLD